MLTATNFNQLRKELKPLEGKAIFKLVRTNSMKDGEFLRVLHKVKQKEFEFFDGEQITHLQINKANDIEFIPNGFKVLNCTYKLLKVMQ